MENTIIKKLELNFNKYTEAEVLNGFLSAAFYFKLPFATWKLPNQSHIHMILDLSGSSQKGDLNLDELRKGFLFCPFIKDSKEDDVFINADIYYNTLLNTPILDENQKSSSSEKFPSILQTISENLIHPTPIAPSYFENENFLHKVADKEDFIQLVKKAITSINNGFFEKVVVSRNKKVPIKGDFNIIDSYLSLCGKYSNAFVSLVTIPDSGTWIGASPETLVKIDAHKTFLTESLAGTQQLMENQPIANVSWTQKEIEEQALVSRYIINCFKKIRLREFEEIGPKTIVAGNLLHLRTVYKVDMVSTGFPELGSIMLDLLHPTSAVCGMPQEPAMEFILSNEKYDRAYYSGYLGPVHFEDEIHLYVNLRCLQLFKQHVILYAGAGILENSDPEKEWRETELKCETLIQGMELF